MQLQTKFLLVPVGQSELSGAKEELSLQQERRMNKNE
jgi:hypothetical protein